MIIQKSAGTSALRSLKRYSRSEKLSHIVFLPCDFGESSVLVLPRGTSDVLSSEQVLAVSTCSSERGVAAGVG